MCRRRAFTLLEMLLATTLVAVLMGGVLLLLGGASRDAALLRRLPQAKFDNVLELLARDVMNAQSVLTSADGRAIELVGNVGIDRRTLTADGRLARVVYRTSAGGELRREQRYLDAPDRPQPWSELAAVEVNALTVARAADDVAPGRIVLDTSQGVVSRELRFK